jgi:hypothetical protein
MTSKEKRQLRNKISARNFRVRRKGDIFFHLSVFYKRIYLLVFGIEYISTLEGDIAERDRLLDAIRSELGSTQSENLALRQEIAALKRTLIEGRGIISTSLTTSTSSDDTPILNLPPPAPLPAQSAAAKLAQQQQQQQQQSSIPPAPTSNTPNFLIPNTQKDVSSTSTNRFWGGVSGLGGMGMGMGGITPVHRVVLPEVSVMGMGLFGSSSVFNSEEKNANANARVEVREEGEKLQENVNPMMNRNGGRAGAGAGAKNAGAGMGAFDGFADVNPFTMKTLDAYRMHLWGKMAAQHHAYQYQQQQQQQQQQQAQQAQSLTGLASSLRPSYFSSPTLPYSSSSTSLSALLSGKHTNTSAPPYSPPPPYSSPKLGEKEKSGLFDKLEKEKERARDTERERARERERETAMYVALASQTLLRRLGGAFWDAFSGGSSSSNSGWGAGGSGSGGRSLDEDKVRRVLEGKAVVRVVDVEEPVRSSVGAGVVHQQTQAQRMYEKERECKWRERKEGERKERERKAMCHCRAAVTDILEESMRSLSLGKKV